MKTLQLLRFLALGVPTLAFAQTYTWDAGGGGLTGIATAANWEGDTAPPNDGSAALVVLAPTSSPGSMNVSTAYSVASLTFGGATQSSFDIFGSQTLTLGSGGLVNATDAPWGFTLSAAIALSDDQVWSAASGSAGITHSGALNLGGHGLTIANSSDAYVELSGSVTGAGGLSVSNGTLRLSGSAAGNSFAGGIGLSSSAAHLYLRGGSYNGDISTVSGSRVQIGFPSSTYSGTISGAGRVTIDSNTTVTFADEQTFTGNLELNSGAKVVLAHDGAIPDNSGGGQVLLNGGVATLEASGSARTVGRQIVFNGATGLTISGSQTLGMNSGMRLTSGATHTIHVSSSGGAEINSEISQSDPEVAAHLVLTGGTLRLDSSGSVTGNTFTGDVTVNGSTLVVTGAAGRPVLNGGVTVANNGWLRIEGNSVLPDTTALTLAGTLELVGVSEQLESLTLQGSSTLLFSEGGPLGSNSLSFYDSSDLLWTEGAILTVVGYRSGIDSLYFGLNGSGGNGLTAAQLAAINFDGFGQGAAIDAYGNVTPISAVPEPTTYAAIFGVAALGLAWSRRGRRACRPEINVVE